MGAMNQDVGSAHGEKIPLFCMEDVPQDSNFLSSGDGAVNMDVSISLSRLLPNGASPEVQIVKDILSNELRIYADYV